MPRFKQESREYRNATNLTMDTHSHGPTNDALLSKSVDTNTKEENFIRAFKDRDS